MANTSVPVSLQEQLGKLQQQYAERLPERLSEIEGTWQALLWRRRGMPHCVHACSATCMDWPAPAHRSASPH